jgi:hypothetical protein
MYSTSIAYYKIHDPTSQVSPTDSYQAVCSAQNRIRFQSLMPPPGLRIGVTLTRSDPKRESESEREDCRLATKRILSSLKGAGAGRGGEVCQCLLSGGADGRMATWGCGGRRRGYQLEFGKMRVIYYPYRHGTVVSWWNFCKILFEISLLSFFVLTVRLSASLLLLCLLTASIHSASPNPTTC